MIHFEKARMEDAKALALISWHLFDHDIHYGAPRVSGPPGYKAGRWQSRMIRRGPYYKILADDQIIGGLVVFQKKPGHCELGRIFLVPEFQNQGIGAQAIQFIELSFPEVQRWTLATPRWNKRNQHFYEKMGYRRVGPDGHDGYRYEKRMPAPQLPSAGSSRLRSQTSSRLREV